MPGIADKGKETDETGRVINISNGESLDLIVTGGKRNIYFCSLESFIIQIIVVQIMLFITIILAVFIVNALFSGL